MTQHPPLDAPEPEVRANLAKISVPQLRTLLAGIERDPKTGRRARFTRQRHIWITPSESAPLEDRTIRVLARHGLLKIYGHAPAHQYAVLTEMGLWYARTALEIFTRPGEILTRDCNPSAIQQEL